jgi:membrane protein DedA with SNARE-associated domain
MRGHGMPLLMTALSLGGDIQEAVEWLLGLPVAIFHGYSSFIRWGADSARSLFEDYGYWVVFFGTLSENTLLVGLIVPGALVVILAGLSAGGGDISLPLVVLLGVLGTVIGDSVSYCLGRFGWDRFGRARIFRDVNEKVREPILRRGGTFVLLYHFAGYTRVVGPAAAGFLKMPFRRWAPADYAGAFLWICAYSGIGYVLGRLGLTLDSTDRWFRAFEWGLLVVVLIWGIFLYRMGQRALLRHVGAVATDGRREDEAAADGRREEKAATAAD